MFKVYIRWLLFVYIFRVVPSLNLVLDSQNVQNNKILCYRASLVQRHLRLNKQWTTSRTETMAPSVILQKHRVNSLAHFKQCTRNAHDQMQTKCDSKSELICTGISGSQPTNELVVSYQRKMDGACKGLYDRYDTNSASVSITFMNRPLYSAGLHKCCRIPER